MVSRRASDQKGFTLIELLLAMAVFSFVMTLCLAIFVQINRLYYRGISITKAQESTRSLMGELTARIQASRVVMPTAPLPVAPITAQSHQQGYYCIGDVVYYYKLGIRASDIPAATDDKYGGKHVLARWTKENFCSSAGPATPDAFAVDPNAVDLVDTNTALYEFRINGSSIEITTAYGSPQLLDSATLTPWNNGVHPDVKCAGGIQVTYCGVSHQLAEIVTRTR